MEYSHILVISSLGPSSYQSIICLSECHSREKIIPIVIGCERSRLADERPDDVLVVDAVLLLPQQAREREGDGCSDVPLQGFCPNANEDVGVNET